MGLFSKPKTPSMDTGYLRALNQQALQKQQKLATERETALKPISTEFETKRKALSAQLMPETETLISRLGQDISGVGTMEKAAGDIESRKFREQQFRDVPAIQQAIRNQLGGSGLMRSGAALSSLAQPTIQAAQRSSDLEAQIAQKQLESQARRAEGLASTGFTARQKALSDRMGLDEGTINSLTQMGRTDLIDKFNALAGAEEQFTSNELAIEQARLADEIARAKQSRGLGSTLGSVAGMGLGALLAAPTGGMSIPMGAALGAQFGGSAGGYLEGGQAAPLDPTLLFALSQQQAQQTPELTETIQRRRRTMTPYGAV